MEQGNVTIEANTNINDLITNSNEITQGNNFTLSRNENQDIVVEEQQELPRNLNTVLENRQYQLTRVSGEVVPIENTGATIFEEENPRDTGHIIRRTNGIYNLTPFWALLEYNFETEDAQRNALFTIGGVNNSRIVHVINTPCRVVRFGVIHFSRESFVGFINTEYRYELIINNVNNRNEIVVPGLTRGNPVSTTVDVEDLNLTLTRGGTLGLRYVSGNVGDFMHCTVTVDTNI